MNESHRKIEQFKQDLLRERLALCTQEQQEFFYKLYPKGPTAKQFDNALDQIDRTIIENQKKHESS